MQRIDENTYIDDTLVTCAEYQLFIDEMREQGKYHQPDHWTSYQFSEGQAREPILGVRHSDAVVFCEWLTPREGGEWKFRLPTEKEVDIYPPTAVERSPLGFWLDENYQFTWIGSIPKDVRTLDLAHNDLIHDLAYARKLANNSVDELTSNMRLSGPNARAPYVPYRDHARSRVKDLDFDIEHVSQLAHDPDLAHARNFALNRPLDLTHDHELVHELVQAFGSGYYPFYHIYELTHNLELALDRNLDHAYSRDVARACALDIARDKNDKTTKLTCDCAFELYVDLYTLCERIAGRSPAFEGIRLVKERIR